MSKANCLYEPLSYVRLLMTKCMPRNTKLLRMKSHCSLSKAVINCNCDVLTKNKESAVAMLHNLADQCRKQGVDMGISPSRHATLRSVKGENIKDTVESALSML